MTVNKTVNPAGMPIVRPAGVAKPYTREDFVRDLKRTSRKTASKPAARKS
jgi:hypothetical protein